MSITAFTADEERAIQEKGFFLRMVCLPSAVIGLCSLAWHWPADLFVVRAIWTCFTAYFLFCWTSCFHETAHQTLTRWRWLDITIGRILGTLMYVPYSVYRESHIRHHAYVNRPNDWELWPYSNPTCSKGFRKAFVVLDIVFGFIVSPFVYGRIYFHQGSPLKSHMVRRTIEWEYIGIVVFWGLVFVRLTYAHTWSRYVEVWLIPHMIAGAMQTIRKLTEHLGMASFDPMLGTRTVVGKNWITRMGSFVNFDIFIHGPHHRHPRLAQNLLKDKMEEYIAVHPDAPYPVYPSYLRATLAMVPFLLTNPGIGVNVGATPSEDIRLGDVTNFSADVVADANAEVANFS